MDSLELSDDPACVELTGFLMEKMPDQLLPATIIANSKPATAAKALALMEKYPKELDAMTVEPLLMDNCARLKAIILDEKPSTFAASRRLLATLTERSLEVVEAASSAEMLKFAMTPANSRIVSAFMAAHGAERLKAVIDEIAARAPEKRES